MKHATGYTLRRAMIPGIVALPMIMGIVAAPVMAADLTATMNKATQDGTGENVGTVTIADGSAGATFKLDLRALPPGAHGFHVHENGGCGPTLVNGTRIPGGAAGGHFDPDHTSMHGGPAGSGHLGDLPALDVAADGTAKQTLIAPRIKDTNGLKGRAVMIHAGGDNYSDAPSPLGGGGGRLACGVVE